eukprot:CAMPEP_0117648444 /NCGR_PEP_ID=MMETSP0804-20121206/407_1 /TAXON_ID=1074897 /ORGANISM="Tetraselmis astigmatica, Strain CCMP880" /LENGTH=290 /DNA_ID=CAMNT_0005454045 /DNA_START=215 /DNA_END=1087 /DNA_ORIENTATION=-
MPQGPEDGQRSLPLLEDADQEEALAPISRLDNGTASTSGATTCRHVRIAAPGRLPASGLSRDGSVWATDEVFNTASHFSAMMLCVLGGSLTISQASANEYAGLPWKIVGLSIYFGSLFFLFLASTLHHAIEGPPALERVLQAMDYAAIYPLIAGTFTPLCLTFLHATPQGWAFIGALWGLSFAGSALTLLAFDHLPKYVSFTMYITMGWMGALLVPFVWRYIGLGGVALLAAGGVLYTVGGAIFTAEKPNLLPGVFGFHEIWHLFVMAGAASHFLLIYAYVLPFTGTIQP